MNRNTGIRGLFKPFRSPKEIAEDKAARAAVISKIGYSAPYNPVDVSTYRISDTLNKLQAAGTAPVKKTWRSEKEFENYITKRPSPSEYKGSWKKFVKQQAAKHANGNKEHIVKNTIQKTPIGYVKTIKPKDTINQLKALRKYAHPELDNDGMHPADKFNKGGIADKKDATNGAKYIPWYEKNPQVQQKPKLKHQLEKEITELKNRNAVLVKHQKPLPDNVEDVQIDFQGQPRGQSSGKTYSVAEATKMNEQWDRISPEDKNTLRMIERVNYEHDSAGNVIKPTWMSNENKLKGYYYNPVTNAMEPRNNPSPHISSNKKTGKRIN